MGSETCFLTTSLVYREERQVFLVVKGEKSHPLVVGCRGSSVQCAAEGKT